MDNTNQDMTGIIWGLNGQSESRLKLRENFKSLLIPVNILLQQWTDIVGNAILIRHSFSDFTGNLKRRTGLGDGINNRHVLAS